MKRDSRLSSVLHVLLHMAHHHRPLTSEELAACLGTNPVVVRRTLSGLRKLGYVGSAKGHGGGWVIRCDLAGVSLLDVYRAVGSPPLLAMGNRTDQPQCLVEQAVNGAVDDAVRDAEERLLMRFAHLSLADLSADFSRRLAARSSTPEGHHDH